MICNNTGCENQCRIGSDGKVKLHCSKKCCAIDNSKKSQEKRLQTNISKYGTPYPISTPETKTKIQNTIKLKYNVENVSQIQSVKDKKKKTTKSNYDVEHPSQSHIIKERIKNTMIDRYGVEHVSYIGKTKDQINLLKNVDKITELNREFNLYSLSRQYGFSDRTLREILQNNDIDPVHHIRSSFEKEILDYVKSIYTGNIILSYKIDKKEIDIFLNEINFGIECNGAYWHSEIAGKRDKEYHLKKQNKFIENKIDVFQLWDFQWYNNIELVKSMINRRLGIYNTIYGRNTVISKPTKNEEIEFFNKNHLQGYIPSKICYCLKYKDNIVAMMSFGKSRYNKNTTWELLRFSNDLNLSVIGGASKLLNYFRKNIDMEKGIISYSHRHLSSGGLYRALNFEYSHTSGPSYKYTRDYKTFFDRITYQKHKLSSLLQIYDKNLTEWENMKNNGFDRIWDCGNDVWILRGNK